MSESKKSPYRQHSVEEVVKTETGSYYIQIGDGMFESEQGKLAFTKERAEAFFQQIMDGLVEMRKTGSQEDKDEAMFCLMNFRIIPLRFH